jgi:PAS domain S-box-containing protein
LVERDKTKMMHLDVSILNLLLALFFLTRLIRIFIKNQIDFEKVILFSFMFLANLYIGFTYRKVIRELEGSNKNIRDLLIHLPVLMDALDEQGAIKVWNKECERVTGYPAEAIIDNPKAFELLYPDPAYRKELINYAGDSQSIFRDAEWEITCSDGTKKTVAWNNISAQYPVKGWKSWAIGVDVTERKQAIKSLEAKSRELEQIIEALPDLYFKLKKDGMIIDFKAGALKNMYQFHKQFIGQKIQDILPEDIHRKYMDMIQRAKDSKYNEVFEYSLNIEEQTRYFEVRLIPLSQEEIIAFVRDITEKKCIEKEMTRIDRFNLIGEMAAGLGHEIRNPLTTVRGFLQLMGRKPEFIQQQENIHLMISELDRANSIITEYLYLAKNKLKNMELMSLNQIIEKMYPLLQSDAISQDKEIKLDLEEHLPPIYLDNGEIRQLILNICRNGLEAMKIGTLTIATRLKDNQVYLSISDEGQGIPLEILDHIGVPFFTTKEEGTGLGIAICYSIASSHHAEIKIDTSPNGTMFTVVFQVFDKEK